MAPEEIANDEVSIEGYDCFRHDQNRQGGGVCIYTSQFLGGAQHLQLQMHINLELLFESVDKGAVPTTIGCFYHPPSTHASIIDDLQD